MSLVTGNNSKGEKSKKFQSLNINNIYQGASSKPQTKSAPQKYGLQSLGKVPPARRAPPILPSLKAENYGNDPTINLVPTAGSGWGGQPGSGQQPNSQPSQQQQTGRKDVDGNKPNEKSTPEYLKNASTSENSSTKSWVTTKKNFNKESSPLFGHEFPSLESAANEQDKKIHQQHNPYPQPPSSQPKTEAGKSSEKYGPGPSLRPQSFGQWSFVGKGQSNNSLSNSSSHQNINNDAPSESITENSRNHPPPALAHNSLQSSAPKSLGSVANTLKFDVSANSPLKYFGGPVVSRKQPTNNSSSAPTDNRKSSPTKPDTRGGDGVVRNGPLFQTSIIDREKLKRMDDFDSNDDDWTNCDETFDYNKKIDSDIEEEIEDLRIESSWTEQLNPPQKENRFDYPPPPTVSQTLNSGRSVPFFDEEDQRRARKNEEVLQSIERARRRREEEEQKYKGVEGSPPGESHNSEAYHGEGSAFSEDNFHPDNFKKNDFRDFQSNNKRQGDNLSGGQHQRRIYRHLSCSSNSSREENSGVKHAPHSKPFEVNQPSAEYDERKPQHHDQGGGYGGRKSVAQPSSVPPRFKRHSGELQQFKRGYQGKGSHYEDDHGRGHQQPSQPQHHTWERKSSESEPDRSNKTTVENSEQCLQPPPVVEEETNEAPAQPSPNQFVALSTSNSKDNFETNSSYSSSSVDRYPTSNPATVISPVANNAPREHHRNYEDRRSAETDLGKPAPTSEKANIVEQPHNIIRSDSQDQQELNKDVDIQPQQQLHHYTNRSQKDEYDYNSVKRNGRDPYQKGEEFYDNYRDHKAYPRGGRGTNGTGHHSSQRGSYRGGRSAGSQRDQQQPPKKIILPSRVNRDRPSSQRIEKRVSSEEIGDIQQQAETKTQEEPVETERAKVEVVKPLEKPELAPTQVEHEAPSQEVALNLNPTGWFAPRGQPSRRGRGGMRVFGKETDASSHGGNLNEDEMKPDEWETSTDKKDHADEFFNYNSQQNTRHPTHDQLIGKGGMDMKDKRGPPNHQLPQQISQQVKQIAYERRQNKLPPRFAKQKEQNRMKYTTRDGWTMDNTQGSVAGSGYQYDQMGHEHNSLEFNNAQEQHQGYRGGEPPNPMVGFSQIDGLQHPDQSMNESHSGTVQTIIFENTNFKGGEKIYKGIDRPMKEAGIQLPVGFGGQPPVKPDDSGDLKLDFTFEPTDMPPHIVDEKMMNRHPGQNKVPIGHPASAEDLNLKIASVKKVWETGDSSMSPGPEGMMVSPATFGSQNFATEDKSFGAQNTDIMVEDSSAGGNNAVPFNKSDLGGVNIAKVRPQMLQQPQQPQMQPHPHIQQQIDVSRGMGCVTAGNVAFGRILGSGGLQTLHSPPSMMNQPPSLYQAFQLDPSRNIANHLSPFQSLLLQSSGGLTNSTDMFAPPPTANQYRMQSQGSGQYAGQQSTNSTVHLSQSLMTSAMKANNQIGPIGTKGGNAAAAFQQNSLGNMPATSPLLIPYDSNGATNIYTMQRSPAEQNAFYQALANSQVMNSRQQAYNMQGFAPNNQQSLQQQHLNAQLRSRGLPYMNPEAKVTMTNPLNDSFAAAAMGANLGLQAHHQMNTQPATNQVVTSMGLNRRSHMSSGLVAGHGGPVGMQQPGPTYSPTPIQRPHGKPAVETEENQESTATTSEKKKNSEE